MHENAVIARFGNIVLGAWLFASAFLWPHGYAQLTNTWIVGAVVMALSLAAVRFPQESYLNAVLAVWLFISAFALPSIQVATVWNNALVAIAIFFVALLPGYAERGPRRAARRPLP